MSRGTFNHTRPPDVFDHGAAALQRWHDERRRDDERQVRTIRWLADHLLGQSFHSLDGLTDAACAVCVRTFGRALSGEEHQLVTAACRVMWCGVVERRVLPDIRCVIEFPTPASRRLTLRAA